MVCSARLSCRSPPPFSRCLVTCPEEAGEDGFDVDGELTLHGVTRPVTLALDINGFSRDPYGNTRAGFSATTEINRGDRLQIFIEVEAILNPPEAAADA
jgi:hypothetical protein